MVRNKRKEYTYIITKAVNSSISPVVSQNNS